MKLFKKLIGANTGAFELRFSKSQDLWHVIKESKIMYMGTKESCEQYMSNMQVEVTFR